MKNRIRVISLLCAFALLLSGCSGMFDTEYRIEEAYVDEYSEIKDDSSVQEVKNYQGMKNALMNLINSAAEYGIIRTEKYKGTAEDDISKACFEVTRETPMGIYAVDYITHSVNRIVSYYEIEIYITYKRTAEEIENVITIHSGNEMQELLGSAMENFESSFAVMQVSTEISSGDIEGYVEAFYRANPQLVPQCPEVTVNTYAFSDSTIQEITEVTLQYTVEEEELRSRVESLHEYARDAFDISNYGDISYICLNVMSRCTPSGIFGRDTAYDALVGSGEVDSEGYAMAVKLLCNSVGAESYVVEGRLNGEKHFWNIVNIRGCYYHVDVYENDLNGEAAAFLLDEDMADEYSWDAYRYPACEVPSPVAQ